MAKTEKFSKATLPAIANFTPELSKKMGVEYVRSLLKSSAFSDAVILKLWREICTPQKPTRAEQISAIIAELSAPDSGLNLIEHAINKLNNEKTKEETTKAKARERAAAKAAEATEATEA